jgi:hypothetical protein
VAAGIAVPVEALDAGMVDSMAPATVVAGAGVVASVVVSAGAAVDVPVSSVGVS